MHLPTSAEAPTIEAPASATQCTLVRALLSIFRRLIAGRCCGSTCEISDISAVTKLALGCKDLIESADLDRPGYRRRISAAERHGTRIATAKQSGPWRMGTGGSAQIGDRVSFGISDVFLPEPSEVLAKLTVDVVTEGVVVEFSDSGSNPRAYAVVRITAQQMVLVPVGALHVLDC